MIWQHRHPLGRTHWEVPAGRVNEGEFARDAAERELLEETGYRAQRWEHLAGFLPVNGISPHRVEVFAALDCALVAEPDPDPSERIVVRVREEAEVRGTLERGEFEDGFTALALFYHFAARRDSTP